MNKKIIHTLIEQIALQSPARVAISYQHQVVSYQTLNESANQVAHTLLEKGVGRGDVVALFLSASPDYIAALLGVLKAGAIFMPMAPDAPVNRQQQILEKAAPKWIITHDDSAHQLPDAAQETVLLLASCRHSACTNPELISVEDDGNYLLFTSGSTGTPKAILGQHKSLSHFIHWEIKELGLDETVRTAFLAAPTFDVSLRDIFVPLLAGGMVCIPDSEVRSQSRLLLNWIAEQQITCLHCVPSLFRLLMQEMEAADRDGSSLALENVLLAGEAVYGRDVEQWRGLTDKHIALINVYGPSETTLAKLFHRIEEEYLPQAIVPIGQPISNTAVLMLKNGRLCGIGEIGEIYIKTPFLTKGYYRDDALTQQVFVQNPLTDDPDIIYKTGDMGRYRADRSVEFLGRQDHQVKVNGIRIELGEIEQVLMQHALVRQAIVVARKNRDASYTLIAYYTLTQPGLSVTELREHTAAYLSDSVLPAFFVEVERFKLNLHGKVDRKALPEPEAMLYEHSGYVEPRNETEADLARIWGQVLTLKQVGIHHTFIELGGDSLKAIRVASHIYRDMHIQISLKDFFQYPSIAELAEFIKGQQTTAYQAIPNIAEQAHYPCSHAQQRLWALQHMDADARAYNISGAYTLRGECNVPALEAAIHQLLMRHEALRTGFIDYQGQPHQQVVADTSGFQLDHQAVSSDEQLQQLIANSQKQTFRLDQAPLLKVSLFTLSRDEHVLVVNIHHLICDAWSLDIMLRELFVLYRGQLNSTSVELPALSVGYKDFAAWQLEQLRDNSGRQSREWWLAHFADIPEPLQLMTDKARPALQTFNGAAESMVLDAVLSNNLKQLARQQQVSLFALLSGLVRVLLYRYTGQADFVLGTAVAGRQHPDLDNQVGLYANTLAWREQIHCSDSFNDVIQHTGKVLNDAFEHQSYPFDRLLQDLNLTQDMSRNPLFDVMVILQNAVTTELSLDNLAISAHGKDGDWESSRFDLTFHFSEAADGQIRLDLNYNTDLFSAARIQSNTRHFEVLATAVCDTQHINTPVSRLPLMTTEEQELQLSGLNQRQQALDSDQTLINLFTAQVQNNPQHPALRWHDQVLTYAELDEKSSHLAQVLRQKYALQNEARVAVSLNRGFNGIVSVLACLKAGVVYVPVDPAYPAERVNYLLSNSACQVLMSEAALIPGLQACATLSGVAIADIDALPGVVIETDASNEPVIHPDQLAFVIHTSGSTGNPKGVMLEQRGFINMILDQIRYFDMQPDDGMLQFASPSFDASLYESFIALLSGATLVLIDRDTIEDTGLFTNYLDAQGVTTAVLPPVYVRALAQHPLPTLRNLMTIGEQAVVDDALFYAQGRRYFNGYGPSEGGICAAVYQVNQDKTYPQGIPVGQATANTRIYILDNELQPVPQGYPGEIFISGMSLARGYLNQAALTQEAFMADPFVAGERIYRSGDLGYRNRDGELCYAGRKDDQIKMAGHRIEPAEIAHCLRQHPTVQDALVLLEPEQNRLVAYVVPESASVAPDAAVLRHYLQQSLPAWMVPTLIQPLAAIPLTVNGKINKAALPVAQLIQHTTAAELRTEQEILLATVWSKVLGVDVIGPVDDYFALGGDSIKAIQISARLREQGYELRVQTLFRYPVLEQAALEMKPLLRSISQDAVAGELALAPVQHWYFELNNPEAHHFNQAVLLRSQQGFDQCCVNDSMEALWQHHDALRTVYQISDRGVQALNQPLCALPAAGFECYDLRQKSQPEQVFQQQLNHIHTQFDLANGPLFKAALFQLPGEERLLLVAHHLVVDGVSWRILLEDFSAVYHLRLNQRPAALPDKTDSYQYFTECLSTYAHRNALAHQTYWQGVDETSGDRLPVMEGEQHNVSAQGMASVQAILSQEETRHLNLRVHQTYNTHTEELLLVALAICLQQVYGISTSKLAIENHGRQDMDGEIDVSRTVGWFTALYPFVLDLPDADTGYQIRFIKEAFRHIPQQGFDYGVLKYITRSLGRGTDSPQQIFNYLGEFEQGPSSELWQPDWENTGDVVSPEMPRQYVLEWLLYVSDGQLRLNLVYDTAYYSEDAAGQLLARYVAVLQELITHCMQQGSTDFSPSDLTFSDLTLEELDAVLEAN